MKLEKYFMVPVFLLRELVTNKEKALNDMIDFGIYKFSKEIKFMSNYYMSPDVPPDKIELYHSASQLLYCWHRKKDLIPKKIIKKLYQYLEDDDCFFDGEYGGFGTGGIFEPSMHIDELMNILAENKEFMEQVIEFAQSKSAYQLMGVIGDFEQTIKRANAIERKIKGKEPMVMVSRDLAFEYRDNHKTEFELMTFAVNLGIRSILGKKAYCKTTKQMIFARAFGFKNFAELEKNKPELFDKYFNRWQTDKLLNEVEIGNWNIIRYSSKTIRGIYVGIKKKITYEKLIKMAEDKKEKQKIQALKEMKNEIRRKVINGVSTTSSTTSLLHLK